MKKSGKKAAAHGGKRKGAGRPPKFADAQYVTVRLPAVLIERLDSEAIAADASRNDIVVRLLSRALLGSDHLPPAK